MSDDPTAFDVDRAGEWDGTPSAASRVRAKRRLEREQRRAHNGGRPRRRPHAPAGGILATRWGRVLGALVAALALATAVALLALWPREREHDPTQALRPKTYAANVVSVRDLPCDGPTPQVCRRLSVKLDEGPDRGRTWPISLGPRELSSSFDEGDGVRVARVAAIPEANLQPGYNYAGRERRGTLVWLLVAFSVLVILLARWRGVFALLGFALSLLLVMKFLIPAILAGSPPMLVAVVGALAVMFVTVGFTYGISPQSAAAALGIGGSLLFAGALGAIAVNSASLDGRSSELAGFLQQSGANLSLTGIVLAGLVLGGLGVLADMAVTQASAVMALRCANPALGTGELFRSAFGVGRDHLVATTHTLVLAYVGATLPLLLALQAAGVSTTDAVNADDVAGPIVATLVGAMALLISVPLTTALASVLVARIPEHALPNTHAGHHH